MPSLKSILQHESSELYECLIRSWGIAQQEWLPTIRSSEGSFNSSPHFNGVERHLNGLLGAAHDSTVMRLKLTPLEIYLLLSAVLFHDFGRVRGDKDHAEVTADLLPVHFTALGLPSSEIASSLSRIALYHDPISSRYKNSANSKVRLMEVKRALRDIRIEPYGTARELYVATLLAVADHMDGSARRSVPRYVEGDENIGFKGAFRRMVSGTDYDPATLSIKTCLSGFMCPIDEDHSQFDYPKRYAAFRKKGESGETAKITDDARSAPEKICQLFSAMAESCSLPFHMHRPSMVFWKALKSIDPRGPGYTIERAITKDESTGDKFIAEGEWPADYLLAIILNDLHENRIFLQRVRSELLEMGLPVLEWFVEFDGEVYDAAGQRTNEKVLPHDFLCEVLDEMHYLSMRIIMPGQHSYDVLADSLRTESVRTVRLAAQRISRRSRINRPNALTELAVFAGLSGWKWQDWRTTPTELKELIKS